ncbi:hypothetical protein B0H11DRAFT_1905217 [Mycena galericulata]|nr:hypothetical protein B0H11DRAFT_1905217 [Mycena galericulata]
MSQDLRRPLSQTRDSGKRSKYIRAVISSKEGLLPTQTNGSSHPSAPENVLEPCTDGEHCQVGGRHRLESGDHFLDVQTDREFAEVKDDGVLMMGLVVGREGAMEGEEAAADGVGGDDAQMESAAEVVV